MFGLGFWEITIILAVAVIILKPQDVPVFLRKLGKAYKWLTDLAKNFTNIIKDAENEIQKSADIISSPLDINNSKKDSESKSTKEEDDKKIADKGI